MYHRVFVKHSKIPFDIILIVIIIIVVNKFQMFAYVKFAGFGASSCMKVVAIEDIKVKRSDVKNIDKNKLYKVKHPVTGKYSHAQVILVNESLEELSKIIQSKRPVVKPIKHLASPSDSFNSSAEETPAKKKNDKLDTNVDTNLQNRLQILRDEQIEREMMMTTSQLNNKVTSTPITSLVTDSRKKRDAITPVQSNKCVLLKKQKLTEISECSVKSHKAAAEAYKNQVDFFKKELQSVKDDLNVKQIIWTEEKTALSREILQKEEKIEKLTNELNEIRNLNKELQKSAIQHFGQIKACSHSSGAATLQELKNAETTDVLNPIKIAIGYIEADTEKIYLGHNVWISTESYALVIGTATTPSMFVAEMMLVLFPYKTLLNSTLSGKPSNRTKADIRKAYKKLDPIKVLAIKAIFRHWLLTEKRMSEIEADEEVDKAKEYMRRKLASMKESRQLQTKKKLSQSNVDELNKQLQEMNAIIENNADFQHDDFTTVSDSQSSIETELINETDNNNVLLSDIGNCALESVENVDTDDDENDYNNNGNNDSKNNYENNGKNNSDENDSQNESENDGENDGKNDGENDGENDNENCDEYMEEIVEFVEFQNNSPN
ncbi:putative uncharacterized protein DDB_G0282129 isoform X1 [Nylanderia fulva]|uniref:putative uncharacterized protein DDB_G0282129 isoform X1 n=1 Tax=Nylanderia fulva TaxID=613905 RepID=UPI0010FB9449|nr:putative uncharacterized protein DDB_G0282129 isoform X1 [Nylanderia fulva]